MKKFIQVFDKVLSILLGIVSILGMLLCLSFWKSTQQSQVSTKVEDSLTSTPVVVYVPEPVRLSYTSYEVGDEPKDSEQSAEYTEPYVEPDIQLDPKEITETEIPVIIDGISETAEVSEEPTNAEIVYFQKLQELVPVTPENVRQLACFCDNEAPGIFMVSCEQEQIDEMKRVAQVALNRVISTHSDFAYANSLWAVAAQPNQYPGILWRIQSGYQPSANAMAVAEGMLAGTMHSDLPDAENVLFQTGFYPNWNVRVVYQSQWHYYCVATN